MLKGLYTVYSGLMNEQNRMDVLANNLANVSTVGYKKEGTTSQSFSDVLAVRIKDMSTGHEMHKNIGLNQPGVKIGENYTDFSQGAFQLTDNTYDVALGGDGFFAVEFTNKAGETSTKYTRAGHFTLNNDGYLVTQEGDYVLSSDNKRIQLDTMKESNIGTDGTISQDGVDIARIQVVDFENYDYLEKYGETYYDAIEGAEFTTTDAKVMSGYLEASNVQTVSEMVDLISISRAYETNQKIMQTYDSILDTTVKQLGRLQS